MCFSFVRLFFVAPINPPPEFPTLFTLSLLGMLTCVKLILRHFFGADIPLHLGWDISGYVGPTSTLSLHRASIMGSVELLDFIWESSCTSVADKPPGWLLAHFLRSDPHYHRWQFTHALAGAVDQGNLEVVKWLLAHFSACEASSTVLYAVASKGHLDVLQVLEP
ncbi:Ankyrin repeat-containing domain [Phytophthora cactorum]|nr:Ankyrin repeat-containing domain [Phytophthora cactorum]